MSSETESLALHLVRALYDSTEGRPQQWRMLAEVDGMTAEAIVFAVARGWTPAGATVAAPSSVEDDGGLSCPPCRTLFTEAEGDIDDHREMGTALAGD